jgi:hypothetical protein
MKRNFDEVILDLDGEPARMGQTVESFAIALNTIWPKLSPELQKEFNDAADKFMGKGLTLASACVGALMGVYTGEETMDDTVRINRMDLARKLHKGGVIDIDPTKERDLVKPLLKKKYAGSVLIPVVAWELLEKEPKESK